MNIQNYNMKSIPKLIIILVLVGVYQLVYSQTSSVFDKALNEASTDLIEKLKLRDKKNVVVLYITDNDKQITNAGKYLADMLSSNIVNSPDNFLVFDRSNLSEILEAKKLSAEGYVDASKAQELGRVLGVNAIVVGNYTLLTNTIKLTLKAMDSGNGLLLVSIMKDLPLNSDAGALLGITIAPDDDNPAYKPASGESIGHRSKNPNCKEKNTGDFCFQNNRSYKINLAFYSPPGIGYYHSTATIESGQKQTFYEVPAGNYIYTVSKPWTPNSSNSNSGENGYLKGNVLVEVCQEKMFVIR